MRRFGVGLVVFGFTVIVAVSVLDRLGWLPDPSFEVVTREEEEDGAGGLEGNAGAAPDAEEDVPNDDRAQELEAAAGAEDASGEEPQAQTVQTSFRMVETVSASGPVEEAEQSQLDHFPFPPMRFHWEGRPEELTEGFLYEKPSGEWIWRGQPLNFGDERDEEIMAEYSPQVLIRLPNDQGNLYFHYRVASRLQQWVEEAGDTFSADPLELYLEVRGGRVLLHTPSTARQPARTMEIFLNGT